MDDGRLTADPAMGSAITSMVLCNLSLSRGIVQVPSATPWTLQDREVSRVHRHGSSGIGTKGLNV